MENLKTIDIFQRLENRQFNSNQIAIKLEQEGYIKRLDANYVSPAGVTKSDMIDKLEKFKNCGSIAEISRYADGKHIVRNANYCGILGCWHCGSRTERKRYKRLKTKIDQATEKHKYAYHVIFTIPDGENVRERSIFLRESLKRFRKLRGGEYGAKVTDGLFSQEIVEGRNSRKFHTHTHSILWTDEQLDFNTYDFQSDQGKALIEKYGYGKIPKSKLEDIAPLKISTPDGWNLKGEYVTGKKIPASKIVQQWHKATRQQSYNIKVKLISSQTQYKKALTEVIKYATKINENAPTRAAQIISDCAGLRFFSTVRGLRFNRKAGELPPEPVLREDAPEEILNLRWNNKDKRYEYWQASEPLQGSQRDKIRSTYQAETARELAEYRRQRNETIKNPPTGIPLYLALDGLKIRMRQRVKIIWQRYEKLFWQPYREIKIIERLKEATANYYSLLSLAWYSGIDEPAPA